MTGDQLKNKFRIETLIIFNAVMTLYLFLHKALVPLAVVFLRSSNAPEVQQHRFDGWWFVHLVIWVALVQRSAGNFKLLWQLVYCGLGYVPVKLLHVFCTAVTFSSRWERVSSVIVYAASLAMLGAIQQMLLQKNTAECYYPITAADRPRGAVVVLLIFFGVAVAFFLSLRTHY